VSGLLSARRRFSSVNVQKADRTAVGVWVGLGTTVLFVVPVAFLLRFGGALGADGYRLTVDFSSVGGLRPGASVEIAGVPIGRVESVRLADYQARVSLWVRHPVRIPETSVAVIKTEGLVGTKHVEIRPGSGNHALPPDGEIRKAVPPIDLEELLAARIFGTL
jgi:phospholipid/cholesterol/gamma-HCH transport system substrate-binding protein